MNDSDQSKITFIYILVSFPSDPCLFNIAVGCTPKQETANILEHPTTSIGINWFWTSFLSHGGKIV